MGDILLVRHCETTGQDLDSPLTQRGREQAVALAAFLARDFAIDRIVASPYRRARDSVTPLAATLGLPVETDARLAERRLAGEFIADREEWLATMRRAFADADLRLPGGETGREALARMQSLVEDVLASASRLTLLATHGQLTSHFLGSIDPSFGFEGWQKMSTPDVFRVEADAAGALRFEHVWTT